MYFHKHELNPKGNAYEVILYIKPQHSLEEFAEEFGFTKRSEEDINHVAIGYVKRKFPALRVKSIKVMMGGALVTTILVGGGMTQAFANELEEVEAETTTETTTEGTTTETDIETEAGTTGADEELAEQSSEEADETTDTSPVEEEPIEEPAADDEAAEVPMDEPGLVPDDFFYFVEVVAEKVQLALTFGDTAKAELISQFANERIAEANAMFEAGDTDGAIELLNRALESQELALDYVTEEEEADSTSPEEDLSPEETEGETAPVEDGDVAGEEEKEGNSTSEVREELQSQFSQNITALLLAMEKVDNPKAKAALAKNVEKAYAKMEKRLGKMKEIEERLASAVPVDEDVEDLRDDIRDDQRDFEESMTELEKDNATAPATKKVENKTEAKAKAENKQEGKQGQTGVIAEKKRTEVPKSQEKRSEARSENKEREPGNGNKAKTETETEIEAEVDMEAGEKVAPSPKNEREKEKNKEDRGEGKEKD